MPKQASDVIFSDKYQMKLLRIAEHPMQVILNAPRKNVDDRIPKLLLDAIVTQWRSQIRHAGNLRDRIF